MHIYVVNNVSPKTTKKSYCIDVILDQKMMAAMCSQMFFGGISGNSVSSGVGMPYIKQKRWSIRKLVICGTSSRTDSDKVHFCGFPDVGALNNLVAHV